MPKEYLYRVANKTPGAPDRLVIANLPGQALRFVTEDTLSVELCDGLTAAELVKAGVPVERAVPADKPEPSPAPQQPLIATASEPRGETYRHEAAATYAPQPGEADAAPASSPDPEPQA